MKIREAILINESIATVWPLLADPARWLAWHPKLLTVSRSRTGEIIPSEQFQARFQMKRRQKDALIDIREVVPLRLIRFRENYEHKGRQRWVELQFELIDRGAKTRVQMAVEHSGAGIPWPFQLLVWLLVRFGKSTGVSPLENLKRIAEGASAALNQKG